MFSCESRSWRHACKVSKPWSVEVAQAPEGTVSIRWAYSIKYPFKELHIFRHLETIVIMSIHWPQFALKDARIASFTSHCDRAVVLDLAEKGFFFW